MSETLWTLAAFVVYLLVMVIIGFVYFKRQKLGGLLPGRQKPQQLDGSAQRPGVRYERLVIDGPARRNLCGRHRRNLDCYRPAHRYGT